MTESYFSFAEARGAAHHASLRQIDAERERVRTAEEAAQAEQDYRRKLSRKIVELHSEGTAWTVAADIARGDDQVSAARFERDVKQAVAATQEQASFRLQADRRILERFCEWSMRRELAEGGA